MELDWWIGVFAASFAGIFLANLVLLFLGEHVKHKGRRRHL